MVRVKCSAQSPGCVTSCQLVSASYQFHPSWDHTPPLQPVPDPALSFLMTSERHRQFGLPRAVMFPKVSVDTTQFPRVMQGEGPTLPSST